MGLQLVLFSLFLYFASLKIPFPDLGYRYPTNGFSFFICSDLVVNFESEENASIVYAALAVDKEVIFQPSMILNLFFSFFGKTTTTVV